MPATEVVSGSGGLRVGGWQLASIDTITTETYRARTLRAKLSDWRPFRPGQHVDVRLTAPDGYQAQRSYSIASAPATVGFLDITIELVDNGEVSPWFLEIAETGDSFEIRGPIGGPFTWTVEDGGPLLLVGGGSGVVPLMSMLRHRQAQANTDPALLMYSARTLDDVIYRDELESLAAHSEGPALLQTLTRTQPPGWRGYSRRIDNAMIADALDLLGEPRHAFVCGPTPFVETVATELVRAGVDTGRIRTERFGPSG